MPGRLIVLAALTVLAACGPREKEATQPEGGAVGAAAPDPLSVRADGVGPLGAGTPFEKAAVERAFPGATVEPAFVNFRREEATPVLNVLAEGTQTLQVAGDPSGRIESVTVTGGGFRGPGGEVLMMRWSETGFSSDDCVMGDGPTLHALVCPRPGARAIEYVFAIPGWTSSETPGESVLAERAFLREMVWIAPTAQP